MPGFQPRKAKPTLSITEMVASETTVANRKIMFLNWQAELNGIALQRDGQMDRHLAQLHPQTGRGVDRLRPAKPTD